MRKYAVMLVLSMLAPSCGRQSSEQPATQAEPGVERQAAREASSPVPAALERKLIKTVHLTLRVASPSRIAEALQLMARELGGYAAEVSGRRSAEGLAYELSLRVPAARLDEAIARAKQLSLEVVDERFSTEDVTGPYVDLQARRHNLEATERELRELLEESRERGREVQEVMAVFERLTEIREQIETLAGQMETLNKLAALSTIHIQLEPDERPLELAWQWRPGETLARSTAALAWVLTVLGDTAIYLVIVALPTAAVILGRVWIALRLRRRFMRRPA